MKFDRKVVDKVLSRKRTFDIITDKRVQIDSNSVCHTVKLEFNIIAYKNKKGILEDVIAHILIYYDNSKNEVWRKVEFDPQKGSFLIYFTRPDSWSALTSIYYDKDMVIDKMNGLTGKEFEDVNKAIVELMLSYKD